MSTLKEAAVAYEPPKTKNIADLEVIPTDLELIDREYSREDGTEFKIKVICIDNEEYRVPISVIKSLKAILEEKPNLATFQVKKTGEMLKTTYTLIPLSYKNEETNNRTSEETNEAGGNPASEVE